MHYIYILRSVKYPKRLYIGLSQDVAARLIEHNKGKSQYTKKYVPWEIEMYIAFKHKIVAESFERYLKSGSGYAFMKKRMLPIVSEVGPKGLCGT